MTNPALVPEVMSEKASGVREIASVVQQYAQEATDRGHAPTVTIALNRSSRRLRISYTIPDQDPHLVAGDFTANGLAGAKTGDEQWAIQAFQYAAHDVSIKLNVADVTVAGTLDDEVDLDKAVDYLAHIGEHSAFTVHRQ